MKKIEKCEAGNSGSFGNVNIIDYISECLNVGSINPEEVAPLSLAFIGDSVYELALRTLAVSEGLPNVNELNHETSRLASASAQSEIMQLILPELTEEELAVYKRGRNVKSLSHPKHCSIGEYRTATGFEALIGYLYLSGEDERMLNLIRAGIEGKLTPPSACADTSP